jgi:hypothetical protein
MKNIFRKHPDALLIGLAVAFLALIVFSFIWGVGGVVSEIDRAMNAKGTGVGSVDFDLKSASKVDWRGLVNK